MNYFYCNIFLNNLLDIDIKISLRSKTLVTYFDLIAHNYTQLELY